MLEEVDEMRIIRKEGTPDGQRALGVTREGNTTHVITNQTINGSDCRSASQP